MGLSMHLMYGQSFLERRNYSISGGYGFGKIQYYVDYSPVYTIGSDRNAPKYSPSWQIKFEGTWWLTHIFDFSLGLSHTTITEKYENNLSPGWAGIGEDHLVQGFLHMIPCINIKLPDDRFKINLGLRFGTGSLIGNTFIRGTSNTLGSIGGDLCLESGFSILFGKKIAFETTWVEGLSRYDYVISMPVNSINFFKYRTFLFGLKYLFYAKK